MARRETQSMILSTLPVMILLLCASTIASAQRYPFHDLSVDDGLIQSQATCMAQDRNGELWIGTLGGLSRYDGYSFTNYTTRDGLENNSVWALAVDRNNNIWIGGQNSISVFNGKTIIHYKRPAFRSPSLNGTQQIQIVNDTVWWRVQGDVCYLSNGKVVRALLPGPDEAATAILKETSGLWVARPGALYHIQHSRTDTLPLPAVGGQRPFVLSLFRDHGGKMWLGTNAGVYTITSGLIVPYPVNRTENAVQPVVYSITQDKEQAIWLATNNGAVRISNDNPLFFNKHNGFSDNTIYNVLADNEGDMWFASDGQGIFRYSGTRFAGLDESMGLPSAQIMAFASNSKDSLFLGTYDAGLYIFKDGKVSPLSFPSAPVPTITSLCYTPNGKLWIGTRGRGLWTYADGTFRQYLAPEHGFPSNFINSLYRDRNDRLWIGFANGVVVYEHDSFKTASPVSANSLSFLSIGNDSVLIATESGLYLYNAGMATPFRTGTRMDSVSIQCLIRQGNYLWAGSSDNGVIRYGLTDLSILCINKSNGLRSDFIYNIIDDAEGNIWLGTGFGIHCVKTDAKGAIHISFYGRSQGVTGMESNMNAALRLPDGSIWFGTTNGALHYQPHSQVVSAAPVSIVLRSVKLAGEATLDPAYYDSTDTWYGVPYHLRLPYKKNNLLFSFQAISLSGAQQILYRYHMDGLEAPWSDWSTTNSVSYSAMPPGRYTFHVQCQTPDGLTSPELSYSFEITTPFQKTKWFRLSILAACILLGFLTQYIINSRKQRRIRLLARLRGEEQAKIRLRTAEDFHDEIGNKLTRINILTSVLKSKITPDEDTARMLRQIEENTSQLYAGTRDILWSLKPSNDNLHEILHHIKEFGIELFQDTEIEFSFTGADDKWKRYRLPLDMSRNLLMIFKEALNNALKYSGAKHISISANMKGKGVLQLVLKDDGIGFDMKTVVRGNGINNMHVRAGRLGAKLYIDSRPGKGTIFNLTFKIPQNR
jgi:ligand-binding sensor domain-containing protein/signal transduction histidine kinase